MKCPSCSAPVADDAAICPNCDHILDPSLFDAQPPESDDEPTGKKRVPAPPPRTASKPGVKKVKKSVKKAGGRMPEAPPPMRREAKPESDWRKNVSQADWDQGGPKKMQLSEPNIKPLDVEDFMSDTKRFVFELSVADKLAFFGAVGLAMSCCFPWKETVQEGEVLGLLSTGVVVFVLAGLALVAIGVRVRKTFGKMSPVFPWVIQLGAIGGSIAWSVIYAMSSIDRTLARAPVGNEEVWVSKPSFGVILAVICGGVAALGTLFGLKEKSD